MKNFGEYNLELSLDYDPFQLIALLKNKDNELLRAQERIRVLEERERFLLKKPFGASSEKMSEDQLELFNEAEDICDKEEKTITVSGHERKKPGRKSLPKDLPRIRVIYDLPEDEKQCSCGCQKECIGEEVSEQLEIIPVVIQVIQHVRLKYACKPCENGVVTAPLPTQPIPKSIASPAFMNKFFDGLPLYRQEKMLARLGFEISRATLASWMISMGILVRPLINLLRDHLMSYDIIGMDETTIQVLKEEGRSPTSKSYMWVQRGGPPDKPVILFYYDSSHGQKVAEKLLSGYQGFVQADGYDAYKNVEDKEPCIILLGCMAHARRKFFDAFKAQKKQTGTRAHQGLSYIKRLYAIEKKIKNLTPEERYQIRQEKAKPILDQMRIWLDMTLPTVPPKSLTGVALQYLHNQWQYLIRYIDDGRFSIDNNLTENAIRPFVIGRKNWLFSDTPKGAEASANLYSLVETIKAYDINPFQYFRHIFKELPRASSVEEIEALLPFNIDKDILANFKH